ncbi:Threonylcarbamoyladenosine tRNA methylthiotransferase [Triplophysa tibetana]|uniref:Threonylcarbamoyladenosine tRNA methylthiotransferase n=1 Tax=Triplophysa tibetana TaxID=1572043 RepID=A0A5A9N1L0_9TELE|nr:Threonylcarbamoyladenosine tRNA methylthiotransferase [Triplophysa tibetana]
MLSEPFSIFFCNSFRCVSGFDPISWRHHHEYVMFAHLINKRVCKNRNDEDSSDADLWLLNSCTVKNPAEDHFRNSINQVCVMSDGGLRLSECGTWINYSLANQNGLHGRHRTNICVVTAAGRFHPN